MFMFYFGDKVMNEEGGSYQGVTFGDFCFNKFSLKVMKNSLYMVTKLCKLIVWSEVQLRFSFQVHTISNNKVAFGLKKLMFFLYGFIILFGCLSYSDKLSMKRLHL